MFTNSQAYDAIISHVEAFTEDNPIPIQWGNEKNFKPPQKDLWCRVTVQYGDSYISGLAFGTLERDIGIISIQCFARKGTGEIALLELADKWRQHFKGHVNQFFHVNKTNAPTQANTELDKDFVMSLVRIDFRIN